MDNIEYIKVKIEFTQDENGDKILDTQTMIDDFDAQMSGLIDALNN